MTAQGAGSCPVDPSVPAEKCPVDHASLSTAGGKRPSDQVSPPSFWSRLFASPGASSSSPSSLHPNGVPANLGLDRETSSIPKIDGSTWVYPSEAQFFAAMARKNHNPQATDMKVIVPIHNAVNERAWAEVMKWETGQGGDKCGGVKLVSFKGRPKERSLKARWKTLWGYSPPFDRHDWIVDRCGTRMRYIIDFYTGHSHGPSTQNLSFYLDVRPAFDNWEGVKLRAEHFLGGLIGRS